MKIDGEFLSYLRFADDIFLCTETPHELQQMEGRGGGRGEREGGRGGREGRRQGVR